MNHVLQAVGAGPATLTVTWTEGTDSYTDTINVFVRPQILSQDGNTILAGGSSDTGSVVVRDGDMIQLTLKVMQTRRSQSVIRSVGLFPKEKENILC